MFWFFLCLLKPFCLQFKFIIYVNLFSILFWCARSLSSNRFCLLCRYFFYITIHSFFIHFCCMFVIGTRKYAWAVLCYFSSWHNTAIYCDLLRLRYFFIIDFFLFLIVFRAFYSLNWYFCIEFFAYTLIENIFFSLHTIGSVHSMLLHFPLRFHNFLIAATFIPWFCLLHLLDRVRKEFNSVPKNWNLLFRF